MLKRPMKDGPPKIECGESEMVVLYMLQLVLIEGAKRFSLNET